MATVIDYEGLGTGQAAIKRAFDLVMSAIGLVLSGWLILLAWLAASFDTRSNGFFVQQRVGKDGRLFRVVKIKTMRPSRELNTTVTRSGDPRITPLGRFFRKAKIDELPQLWNVLWGDMSFVGPRPDVPGFADSLVGEERCLLSIRPGITGPATLKYRNEEELLAAAEDPEAYNRDVIWPDKVRINLEYIRDWSLTADLRYIWKTVVG
ncbi:sugar transferase [Chromohalobacter israelensis]|uniref:sugar transferase n=1 Tax=Chromohalobacter israelensis TaxID=141390 RepID=UPI000FFF532D|nr:sugar transferase [Chromohalobacter salexigens]RXE48153.1 sugar transferase [Chromohalobacter salexigens]